MFSILRREISGYFDSMMGFGVIGAFVTIMMLLSVMLDPFGGGGNWFDRGELSMRTFFGIFPWVAAVVIPAVSMRLWSDDKRQGTFEMLMTLPIPTWKVATAKYFAGVAFFVLMLCGTLFYPVMLMYFGTPDWGPIIGGYIACLLLGMAFIAIGMFVSGLTENQALSFFLAMMLCLALVGMGELRGELGTLARENTQAAIVHVVSVPLIALAMLTAAVTKDRGMAVFSGIVAVLANAGIYLVDAPKPVAGQVLEANIYSEGVIATLSQVSVLAHFNEIQRGVMNTEGLMFFVTLIVLFVLLNVWSLESRRYN
ncbi:MAG: ABC-2 transporter permease [Planctomycetes bacterium]|nr:ABC-2 transporter permease [Planctomycetota bacterium]